MSIRTRIGQFILLLLTAMLLCAGAAAESLPESSHPYESDLDRTWTYTHPEEVPGVWVTFSQDTEFEDDCDFFYITGADGVHQQYTGTQLSGKTLYVTGDSFTLRLVTDGSENKYGFSIAGIAAQLEAGDEAFTIDSSGVITSYAGYSENLVVPDVIDDIEVIGIGSNVFRNNYTLCSISLPDSVTSIGDYAFSNCTGLSGIKLPQNLTSIGAGAFSSCSSLYSIGLPEGLTSIGSGAFTYCTSLNGIRLPESLTSIGSSAFYRCRAIREVYVSSLEQWLSLSFDAEDTNPLGNADNGFLYIGDELATDITIPDGITSIGDYAFYNCTTLRRLHLPESLTSIGDDAFSSCENVEEVYAASLESWLGITYGRNFSHPLSSTQVLTPKLYLDNQLAINVEIPETITQIGDYAFSNCRTLKRITLPEGLTIIGSHAFAQCKNLESINVPQSLTHVGSYAFSSCSSLTGGITLPEGITSIDSYAFSGCSKLTSVDILGCQTSISEASFSGCTSLKSVSMKSVRHPSVPHWGGITSIGKYAFRNCSSLESISLPEDVTSIDVSAFEGCSSLESIRLPEILTSIGYSSFQDCSSLSSVILPKNLTGIEPYAFYRCSGLSSINLPESLTSIGSFAFGYCSSLSKVYLPGEKAPTYNFSSHFSTGVTVYCHEGSAVETWAKEKGYTCKYIDQAEPDVLLLSADTELYPDETLKLQVQTFPKAASDYNIVWQCTDSKVVSVENGELTALSEGTATVTASCGVVRDSIVITVLPVTTPKFMALPENVQIDIDEVLTIPVQTSPLPASEYDIAWESSMPDVATVENGTLTPCGIGTTTITVSCGSKSDSMTVTVYKALKSFDLSAEELWITHDEASYLYIQNILPEDATDYTFTYNSSDSNLLWVYEGGLHPYDFGDAVVTVLSSNGIKRECLVHICAPVTAIEFSKATEVVSMGRQTQLLASVTSGAQKLTNKLVTFSSSDDNVATVDANGIVTPISPGTVTITVTAASGITAQCSVTINPSDTIFLPAALTAIEDEAFVGMNMEIAILQDKVETIGSRAFAECSRLTLVHMPDSVKTIAEDAFEGSKNVRFLCESDNEAAAYAKTHEIPYSIAE